MERGGTVGRQIELRAGDDLAPKVQRRAKERYRLPIAIDPTEALSPMDENMATGNYIELTANIVSAYVSNNTVPASDIPALINQVHGALLRVSGGQGEVPSEPLKPAIPVKRSITPEHIVCLEDGKKFKSLKRHLRTQYNMTPEQYREKWALPPDYPMVAPNYAAARSQLAKQMGLGQQRRRRR
jgi:predicted transcriptional regulator